MTGSRLFIKLLPAIALIALAVPASSSAQATRTWVSGVGDDANPCSRTAPCKTFAGAISKTATNGEINCLDPGGFGGVTITKSIAIKCHYTEGGVLVSGTNAIVVNAAATSNVTLRGLDINGLFTGLNGVRILQAKSVKILDSEIFGFVRNAVDVSPSNNPAKVGVYNTHIHDITGNGVMVTPSTTGLAKVTVKGNIIEDLACGIAAGQFGADPAFNFNSGCGILGPNANQGQTRVRAVHNTISDTGLGVFSRGGNSQVSVGANEILNNTTGIFAQDGGSLRSFGDNFFAGNGSNGSSTGAESKGKRVAP